MTDNVIEKLIEQWKGAASQMRPEQGHPVVSCAQTLHEWTRPEQFMPPLSEWPDRATHCSIDPFGRVHILMEWHEGHKRKSCCVGDNDRIAEIPLGIDWRTLKVSREQIERWEAER